MKHEGANLWCGENQPWVVRINNAKILNSETALKINADVGIVTHSAWVRQIKDAAPNLGLDLALISLNEQRERDGL